ncbi:MAG: hypothetical protein ABJC33_01135 [Betaproteobacteria bacterium]
MALTLSLPTLDANPGHPPETRPATVSAWLDGMVKRDPPSAARVIGDALAATNRVVLSDSRRLQLAERYWAAANELWSPLERRFGTVPHPLTGDALESAKAALSLSDELSTAYKHLLSRAADRRLRLGGAKQLAVLIHRVMQSTSRTITNSYLAYSPVPAKTWLDAHRIHAFARERNLHLQPSVEQPHATPELLYTRVLLLALANPYGFLPGQLGTVIRYVQAHAHRAKLTAIQPVHRMAKAVAIIPVGHDFPPFPANKGGAIEGEKMFLLTYDLAFQLQEELRGLQAGAPAPAGVGGDGISRRAYIALLRRLLRQWAIPPARQFNRLPSKARVLTCAGLASIWQLSRNIKERTQGARATRPPLIDCQVMNHTPAGYALRQVDGQSAALRISELIAITVEGRETLQIGVIRWFRNALQGGGLEFGCELLSDHPQVAEAAPEGASEAALLPVIVLPQDAKAHVVDADPLQVLVPVDRFRVEQAIRLDRGEKGFAVLTKLVEQGPGFELYDFVPVG